MCKWIFAMRSDFFKNAFYVEKQNIVYLEHINTSVFKIIVKWMYTDVIENCSIATKISLVTYAKELKLELSSIIVDEWTTIFDPDQKSQPKYLDETKDAWVWVSEQKFGEKIERECEGVFCDAIAVAKPEVLSDFAKRIDLKFLRKLLASCINLQTTYLFGGKLKKNVGICKIGLSFLTCSDFRIFECWFG
jgi:hypothetical protein